MINNKTIGFNQDLDLELRAEQNFDFEQQYLDQCLRETQRISLSNKRQLSQTQSIKSCEGIEIITSPKGEEALFENQISNKMEISQSKFIPHTKTGASMMAFFLIRRFLQKLQLNRLKITQFNVTHYNLIGDKAADYQHLVNYAKTLKGEGLSLKLITKMFTQTKDKKESQLDILQQALVGWQKKLVHWIDEIFHLVPIIHPESAKKLIWDYFAAIFRIILIILVPLEISFCTQIMFQDHYVLTYTIIIVLILDTLIRINTIIYLNGSAIMDRWKIMNLQLRGSFFGDSLCIIILLVFLNIPIQSNNFNLVLLLTFNQYRYIYQVFSNSEQTEFLSRPQRGIIGLIMLVTTLLQILHIYSCIWFWFSSISMDDSWITFKDLSDKPWEIQYLEALYFAVVTMLTIGYGDNVPKNSIEKIITIIFILVACLWFSYSVNFIGNIINDITQNQMQRNQKMRVINKYMNKRKIPYGLQHQIKEYLTYRWKEDDEVDLEAEEELLGQLSDELKEELDKQAHSVFIQKSELLMKYFSSEFRGALFKSIRREIIPPQNIFNIAIHSQFHLCYIEQGKVLYQHESQKQRSKMNSIINQGDFICVKDFINENQDLQLFKALGYVSLLILSKQDFLAILKDYPEDYQRYCNLRDDFLQGKVDLKNAQLCPACDDYTHNLKQCSQIQFIPNREVIVKRHVYSSDQPRHKYQRSKERNLYVALCEKDLVGEFAKVFQQENPQLIKQQLLLQLVIENDQQTETNICPSEQYTPKITVNNIDNQKIRSSQMLKPIQSIRIEEDHKESLKHELKPSQARIIRKMSMYQSINNKSAQSSISQFDEQQTEIINNQLLFDKDQNDNIINLYNKLLQSDEENINVHNAKLLISPLYQKITNKEIDSFEVVKNFDYYNQTGNIQNVIRLVHLQNYNWQKETLDRLQKFMLFPFLYIQKYLSLKRRKMQKILKSTNPLMERVKNKLKMIQLRNTLQQKKISSMRNIRYTQILPSTMTPLQQSDSIIG